MTEEPKRFSAWGFLAGFGLAIITGLPSNLFLGFLAFDAASRWFAVLLLLLPGALLAFMSFAAPKGGLRMGLLTGACLVGLVGGACGAGMSVG